jgi:hypothetical protein
MTSPATNRQFLLELAKATLEALHSEPSPLESVTDVHPEAMKNSLEAALDWARMEEMTEQALGSLWLIYLMHIGTSRPPRCTLRPRRSRVYSGYPEQPIHVLDPLFGTRRAVHHVGLYRFPDPRRSRSATGQL